MSTDKLNSSIPLDKYKVNQPTSNPYFSKLTRAYKFHTLDGGEFGRLLQEALTYAKATAHLSYRNHFKPTYHSKLCNVSRETFYTWIEKYEKGGVK